jgi:hypothetical protein
VAPLTLSLPQGAPRKPAERRTNMGSPQRCRGTEEQQEGWFARGAREKTFFVSSCLGGETKLFLCVSVVESCCFSITYGLPPCPLASRALRPSVGLRGATGATVRPKPIEIKRPFTAHGVVCFLARAVAPVWHPSPRHDRRRSDGLRRSARFSPRLPAGDGLEELTRALSVAHGRGPQEAGPRQSGKGRKP